MSAESVVFWAFVVAWVVVLALLAFVQLPRIVGEASRIVRRVRALSEDSPLPLQVAKAEADIGRIERALSGLPALEQRAVAALAAIRTAPVVPAVLRNIGRRIAREIREFRRAYL